MPTIDPNVVYVALVISLWLGVTATYIPGTGVMELLAVISIIGTISVLGGMPTQWWAVIALVVGVLSFIVMPFLKQQFVGLAAGGLILQAAGGWFMFADMKVSPLIIGLTVLISLMYHRYALIPALERMRKQPPAMDEDAVLIGATGRVVKALDPIGTINVHGEMWTATSNKTLKPGTEVVVLERNGLNVYVEGVKQKRSPVNSNEE